MNKIWQPGKFHQTKLWRNNHLTNQYVPPIRFKTCYLFNYVQETYKRDCMINVCL